MDDNSSTLINAFEMIVERLSNIEHALKYMPKSIDSIPKGESIVGDIFGLPDTKIVKNFDGYMKDVSYVIINESGNFFDISDVSWMMDLMKRYLIKDNRFNEIAKLEYLLRTNTVDKLTTSDLNWKQFRPGYPLALAMLHLIIDDNINILTLHPKFIRISIHQYYNDTRDKFTCICNTLNMIKNLVSNQSPQNWRKLSIDMDYFKGYIYNSSFYELCFPENPNSFNKRKSYFDDDFESMRSRYIVMDDSVKKNIEDDLKLSINDNNNFYSFIDYSKILKIIYN
jgi:hypothetical protein